LRRARVARWWPARTHRTALCCQRQIGQYGEVGSPAQSVVLSPLTKDLAALVASWFIEDEEGQRRLDSDFYGADLKWWRLVQHDPARYGWVGLLDDEPIGFLDLEIEGERAGIAIYVRREFRRRGIGKQLLRLAAVEGRSLGVPELVGSAERDNAASTRCLIAAGFTEAGADELGPLFRLHLSDA
jgi:RimJ/RimL family protein N-acetyltransferase